jgi:outer membrane protein
MAKPLVRYLTLALLMLAAPAVWADDSGDPPKNAVGLGWYFIFYHVYGSEVTGPFTPAGAGLDVKDTNTLYAAYFRRLSPHFQFELAAGEPPLTKSTGKGPATLGSVPYNGEVITTARWLAPAALIKYNFGAENSLIRPYVGLGVNFVSFYDRNSTAAGNAAAGGPTRIELSNSLGAAATVGFNVKIAHNFSGELSWSESRVHTTLHAITDTVVRTSSIDFNPGALVVAAIYAF